MFKISIAEMSSIHVVYIVLAEVFVRVIMFLGDSKFPTASSISLCPLISPPPPTDDFDEVDAPLLSVTKLRQRLAAKLGARPPQRVQEKKPEREIRLNLSMTETDFVVVEDMTSLDSNAVVLKVN